VVAKLGHEIDPAEGDPQAAAENEPVIDRDDVVLDVLGAGVAVAARAELPVVLGLGDISDLCRPEDTG